MKVKSSTFWAKIPYIVGIVAGHSRSLINDCDNNAVEQFNSIIAKFVNGKRTNLVQRRTYQSRCAAAFVAFNTKMPLYNLQKNILGKSPKTKLKSLKKIVYKNILIKNYKRVRNINFDKYPKDQSNGTYTCQKPDMDEEVYEMTKRSFLKNLQRTDF